MRGVENMNMNINSGAFVRRVTPVDGGYNKRSNSVLQNSE